MWEVVNQIGAALVMPVADAASSDASVTLALVGIVGTVIGGMFKLLRDNTKALNNVAVSSDKVAKATTKSAKEAKQRNGHLGEQNVQIVELITGQNRDVAAIKETNAKIANTLSKSALIAAEDRDVLNAPTIIKDQHVEHQDIQQQVIATS